MNDDELRDMFATVALVSVTEKFGPTPHTHKLIASMSYDIAEAMLKERSHRAALRKMRRDKAEEGEA